MKKILISLLMLCGMTAAWAGTGNGTKDYPYTGEWNAGDLIPKLKEGSHLAYDCIIESNVGNGITVFDDKIGNVKIVGISAGWSSWGVGYAISDGNPLPVDYKDYYSINSPEDRKNHTFIVTNAEYHDATRIYITGHYSGHYDRGDGTKENPYCGEWTMGELGPKLKPGDYLAYDLNILTNGYWGFVTVRDDILGWTIAPLWSGWSPKTHIENPEPGSDYEQYGKDNLPANRKEQAFILTYVHHPISDELDLNGYYSGFYRKPDPDGFYHVGTAEQMKIALQADANAKIRLTGDIYMSDLGEGESGRHTLCSTFGGTLDGDGHTIWAARPEVQHDSGGHYHRQYLFTYCKGATVKNLTFRDFRVQSEDNYNQAVITSQAHNHCVFENITLDHISLWCGQDNAGTVTGYTEDCAFRNITVRNSDVTVDDNQSGDVVGHAKNCEFTNIKVEHCESTAKHDNTSSITSNDGKAGGVAGRVDDCTLANVEILESFIKTSGIYAGGVTGYSTNSKFRNCTTDDQTCVCVDESNAGGIVGHSQGDEFHNCINSALVASNGGNTGGIAGYAKNCNAIEDCLNTGMVIAIAMSDVKSSLYNKYRTKTDMTCVTKAYKGKEYVIRRYSGGCKEISAFGGIVGQLENGKVSKCTNLGSLYSSGSYVGGIAGQSIGTISDCLCDFSGHSTVKGISGMAKGESTIKDCLNLTTYRDIMTSSANISGMTIENINTFANISGVPYEEDAAVVRDYELTSGKICHYLGDNWEQNIGADPYPVPGDKGLRHTRKISNMYGTACFPFPVKSDDKISYYFLHDIDDEGQDIKLVFQYDDEEIQEGWPVLFRAAEAKDANADNPVEVCFNKSGEGFTEYTHSAHNYWEMRGTLDYEVEFNSTTNTSSDYIYYVSDGQICNAEKVTIAPYHAYIKGPGIHDLTAAGFKSILIVIEDKDGTTTTIDPAVLGSLSPERAWGESSSYSLMGIKVDNSYRGIVIRNGRKYVK